MKRLAAVSCYVALRVMLCGVLALHVVGHNRYRLRLASVPIVGLAFCDLLIDYTKGDR